MDGATMPGETPLNTPIFPWLCSVNQTLPSGPTAIPPGLLFAVGTGNSVIAFDVLIWPIALFALSVNHTLSFTATSPLMTAFTGNCEITPAGVIVPTDLSASSVNHKLPSGPAAIHCGPLLKFG